MKFWFADPRHSPSAASPGAEEGPVGSVRVNFDTLVVSPVERDRQLLESAFTTRGHQVSCCVNRWTAMMSVKRATPMIAVIDCRLPGDAAAEIIDVLRRAENGGRCWIAAVSDSTDSAAVAAIVELGVNDVLLTPLVPEIVALRVRCLEERVDELRQVVASREELQKTYDRFLIATRSEHDGLWDWDLERGTIDFSDEWLSMLGLDADTAPNTEDQWFERVHEADREQLRHMVARLVVGEIPSLEHSIRLIHTDGSLRHVLVRAEAVRKPDGTAVRLVGRQTDITGDEGFSRDRSAHMLIDPLTRLSNRAVLMDRLGHAFARAQRPSGKPFAVLFFDLDRFKNVNDGLGHLVGDKLLCAIADRVRAVCRPSDTVCRFGGDEFVIVAEDVETIRQATHIAERLHQEFLVPFTVEGAEVYTGISTGIAMWNQGYVRPGDLLRDADNAMYRAKAGGRNRYAVFDEQMHAEVVATLALENDLRRAVVRGEFRAYYQPIIVLATGRVVGFEVLARWQHPEKGLLLPGTFIKLSEEMGVAVQIDRLVADEACRRLRAWQLNFRPDPPLSLSINISTTQFLQPDLVTRIDRMLRQNGLYGSSLKLEVTESVLMENTAHASAMLDQLRALDVAISIDDFGTGYSSLAYLRRFEIDTLKIDYSFVSRMLEDGDSSEIVRTIANLAKNLGKETVAEGVETRSQLVKLSEMGVDRVQGFYIARPMPPEKVDELLDLIRFADNHVEAILDDRLNHRPASGAESDGNPGPDAGG